MSLPAGAFFTTIGGRRCTAVPRAAPATTAAVAAGPSVASVDATPATTPATTTTAAGVVAADGNANADANPALAGTTTSSTSTTSSSSLASTITTSTTSSSSLVLDVGEARRTGTAISLPPALAVTAPVAALPAAASPTLPTFTVITPLPQSEPAATVQTNEADNTETPSVANVATNSPEGAFTDGPASPAFTEGGAAATPLFTTIGTAQAPADAADPTNTVTTNSAVSAVPSTSGNSVQSTVAVAGGVIGGVVAISIVAFLIWWWKRRVKRKRRSTLLTPLDAANYRDEKGGYVINRGSIGPTPVGEKFRAALGYNVKKFRGRMSRIITKKGSSPSVNLDRGTSQFIDVNTHSRATSSASNNRAEVTTKDRFLDWWSRLTADMNFNWRMRDRGPDRDALSISGPDPTPRSNGNNEKRGLGAQPDFLTLLNMDDRELDREAQRRRASLSRKNGGSAGSANSTDHFLGRLNLDFNSRDDPFSDANALAHNSAKPAPLNPFSDSNAIRDPSKPNTYVADIRRSRGQSVSSITNTNRAPSTVYGGGGNRDSAGSQSDFANRRNKFRSDPFDLERPELLASARAAKNSITSSTAGTAGSDSRGSRISGGVGTGDIRRPAGAHTRSESFTSKYSSGISMGDWSDPGPDVGPAAARGGTTAQPWEGPEKRESPTQGWRDRLEREQSQKRVLQRQDSGSSGRSVGKAM